VDQPTWNWAVGLSVVLGSLSSTALERYRKLAVFGIPLGSGAWGLTFPFTAGPDAVLVPLLLFVVVNALFVSPLVALWREQDKRGRRREEERFQEALRTAREYRRHYKYRHEVVQGHLEGGWHVVLGVKPGDSRQVIRRAFVALAIQLHTDSTGGRGDQARMREVIEAWGAAKRTRGWR